MPRLLFRWTDNALIVANTGRRFTIGGLEALCASHLSDKTDGERRVFASSVEASDLVAEIQRRYLEEYKANRRRITEDARAEAETGRDYSNRLLLELMQNADDAAAEKPIGYKGLGFKAVLDVCESVFIYSGHLRVTFDRSASREILQNHDFGQLDEVPVLRLPSLIPDGRDDEEARQLLTQYDTVIVLPWKTDRILDSFRQEWQSVSADATVLLLLHALRKVVWESPDGDPIEWQCRRDGDIKLTVKNPAGGVTPSRWRIFREQTQQTPAAVAIPFESSLQPYHHDKVRVFFPTEESSPVPMILHGEFDLEQNRKRVRPAGNRDEIVQSLARCVALALSTVTVTDDGTFLDLLQPRVPLENMTTLEREIWSTVKTIVKDMKLPQSRVRVSEVRLCPEAGGDFPWSSHQRLSNWSAFKEVLRNQRPGGLSGLNVLSPGVDTPTREQVIRAFNPGAHFITKDLQVLPLFPIGGQEMPVAVWDYHLFFPPQDGQPQSAPGGIRIAFLQKQFSEECSKKAGGSSLLEKLGIAEFSPANISKALSGQELECIQPEVLWNYLHTVVTPMLNKSNAVMNWKDKHRERLIERIKVPCRNGDWRPAIEVYAGRDWTGDNFLEDAYASRSDRAFLCPPPEAEENRKHFKLLARWLGVGWSSKVLAVVNCADKPESREGARWSAGSFLVSPPTPSKWQEHCAEMDDGENRARTARLRQDWTLDGNEEVLKLEGAFACVTREWNAYEDYLNAVVYRSSNMQEDYDNRQLWPTPLSYLAHLFKHVNWIPVEEGDRLAAAHDVFIKGKRVHEELKGWVFAPSVEVNTAVAEGIGIRSEWEDVKRPDWLRWLKQSLELKPTESHVHQAHITALYQQALRHFGERYDERDQRLWHEAIWCVEKRPDNTAVWHLENDSRRIFYVDRPDLSRLRWDKLRIFPVELGWAGNREKVRQIYNVLPLSEHLRGEAEFTGDANDELAEKIRERLQNRVDCLAAFLKVKGKEPVAAQERWKELVFHVGHDLRVSFLLNEEHPEIQPAPTFFQTNPEQTRPALWLDATENFTDQGQPRDIVWEEVGSALCYAAGLALEDGTVFGALLGCGEDSLKRKLLNLGVTKFDVQSALGPISAGEELRQPKPPGPKPPMPEEKTRDTEPTKEAEIEIVGPTLDEIAPSGDLMTRLRKLSEELASETPERVEAIVSRTVRRDTDLIQALKQLCEYRCQFPNCPVRIPKKGGGYYIEVHHIMPMRSGGRSVLGNLLVLCPNHHKEFEVGHVEIIEQTPESVHGKLNGKEFKIELPRA